MAPRSYKIQNCLPDLTILETGEGRKAVAPSDVYFGADEGDRIFEGGTY